MFPPSKPNADLHGLHHSERLSQLRARSIRENGQSIITADCVLKEPFRFETRDLHGTQQGPLNAELRGRLESCEVGWAEVIQQAHGYITRISSKSDTANSALLHSLRRYQDGFSYTEQQPLDTKDIILLKRLSVSNECLADVCSWTVPDEGTLQHAFKQLQSSDDQLSMDLLRALHTSLSPLDALCGRPVSDCSVAMHERHHTDVARALREELEQGAPYLIALDKRMSFNNISREEALEKGDYTLVNELLKEDVAVGSSLVKLNVKRMGLFDEAAQDAAAFRKDIADIRDAADVMARVFRDRISSLERDLSKDLNAVANGLIPETEEMLKKLEARAVVCFSSHNVTIENLRQQELLVWKDILERMNVLCKISNERRAAVEVCMRDVEEISVEKQRLAAEHKALLSHAGLLRSALVNTDRAKSAQGHFEMYTEKMSTALEDDIQRLEAEIRALKLAEGASVISRYSRFSDVAEELKHRTLNRIEGISMVWRERTLALETAGDTLDTRVAEFGADTARAEYEANALADTVRQTEESALDIKGIVDPIIQFAIREGIGSNKISSPFLALAAPPIEKRLPDTKFDEEERLTEIADRSRDTIADEATRLAAVVSPRSPWRARKALEAAAAGVDSRGDGVVDLAAHPQTTSALRSLPILDSVVERAAAYVDLEQSVAEERRAEMLRTEKFLTSPFESPRAVLRIEP